ncbi:gp107 [Rhodococcus phage ReqiPoco6]|uniref:Gp107 n=1 Tax=Rhodococcus phage ReqiPoco6 TaxID=691964 RepID=D4P7X5_9CAUD|nr:gp107 [Rhodococcus phage ReqiPoco6]ADD81105.1 gp107 [Rhodococcus phage ReqiPoco6]
MDDYMLSTSDNPFNPYTQWEQWYAFDAAAGYHTPAYLARIVVTSHELSEADQLLAIKEGIDEILAMNLTGNYIKVMNPAA